MSRYFIKRAPAPRAEDEDYWYDPPVVVSVPEVSDHEPMFTGIVDAEGNAIMRAPLPIGFGRDGEW